MRTVRWSSGKLTVQPMLRSKGTGEGGRAGMAPPCFEKTSTRDSYGCRSSVTVLPAPAEDTSPVKGSHHSGESPAIRNVACVWTVWLLVFARKYASAVSNL